MHQPGLDNVQAEIAASRALRPVGRILSLARGVVAVGGLGAFARVGDIVSFSTSAGDASYGEVISIEGERVMVLSEADNDGRAVGDPVVLSGRSRLSPDGTWIGRIIDPMGRPLDKRPLLRGLETRAINAEPPPPTERRGLGARVETGLVVFNTFLPIVRGQRLGLFAGSGVGKSTLLAQLAQNLAADVIVIALVGERGREVRDFVTNVLGPEGMKKTVVVAATSDRSPLMRRRCAWTAMAVAEHFRDAGSHVLLLIDSLTRFAEAHREIALASGETASLRGFPPSTSHVIPALCERAGPGGANAGDITAIFSVLVAGSDMEEPIADIVRGVLDGHVVLDRKIAERGRFPAIDVLRSVSRALPAAAAEAENRLLELGRSRLGSFERNELMIKAGLYEKGNDEELDLAVETWPELDRLIAQRERGNISSSFEALSDVLSRRAGGTEPAPP